MADLVRRTIGPAISLDAKLKDDVWAVNVDPNQLENALLNLSINARDAMPDGGQIVITTENAVLHQRSAVEHDLAPGEYVVMTVSDTGVGMPTDVISKAFDPFFTTKPIGVGTGLGLSMIYGFARQSGGQVSITSEVGKGTRVSLYLPRALSEPNAVAVETAEDKLEAVQGGGTVLVVEDEILIRALVVELLEDLGFTALEAGDGIEAMKILETELRIDLLTTDVGLPNGMNGRQVADAARVARPGLKVLFMTGYAEHAVLKQGSMGADMHIVTKPFDLNDMGRRIKDLVTDAGAESR